MHRYKLSENESIQKEEIMEENITEMIDKLLKDDEEKETMSVLKNKIKPINAVITPILCVNDVPLENTKNLVNIITKLKKNYLGINLQNIGLGEKLDNISPSCSRRPSSIQINSNDQNFNNNQINNLSFINQKEDLNLEFVDMKWNKNSNNLSTHNLVNQDHKSISSNNNLSSEIFNKMRPKQQLEENQNNQLYELNELIENGIKFHERIEEEFLPFLKGNFLKIAKSQNGSRILQKALSKSSQQILSIIFEEIKTDIHELMVDSYANYFCQRFYEFLEQNQKIEFLCGIGNSPIGTYPLQAIIDQIKTDEERKIIIDIVKDNVIEMSENAQGTHVIEKIIICFCDNSIKEIYDIILQNFIHLACHSNGLCVTKKIISCSKNPTYIELFQKILLENANSLVVNCHGNYSIQAALDSWDNEKIAPIIKLFYNKFFTLSTQKFSSNVVEKCLERGGELVMTKFIDEISHKSKIIELMKNPFGNYVIQKALKIATGYHKAKLTGMIKKYIEKLNDKKLIAKWKTIISSLTSVNLTLGNLQSIQHIINNDSSHFSSYSHSSNSPISNHSGLSPSSFNSNTSKNMNPSLVMRNFITMNSINHVNPNINRLFIPVSNIKSSKSENSSPSGNMMYNNYCVNMSPNLNINGVKGYPYPSNFTEFANLKK